MKTGINFKRTYLLALIITIPTLLIGLFLAWYNNKVVPGSSGSLAHYPGAYGSPLRFLAEWDSRYFIGIAQHGYMQPSDPAFFPLYPLLIKVIGAVIGSVFYASLLISWLSFYGSVYFYLKISDLLWKPDINEKVQAALFFVLFPTAMFMLTAYSEALFMFASLAAIYFCLKDRYLWCGLALLAASATRVTGVFTIMLVILMMLEKKRGFKRVLEVGLIGIAGLAAYSVYLQIKFHNFAQYVSAEKYWGRFGSSYTDSLQQTATLLNLMMVLLILITAYYWLRHKRYSFAVYSLAFLLIPAVTGGLTSLNRFALADFPIMFMLFEESRKRPALQSALLCVSACFWTYFLLQFAGGFNGG